MAAPAAAAEKQGSTCSAAVLEAIYGTADAQKKKEQYDASLGNWWKEYAGRKNDEEEEHVADSLLYDERCHLPRMAQKPDIQSLKTATPTQASADEKSAQAAAGK